MVKLNKPNVFSTGCEKTILIKNSSIPLSNIKSVKLKIFRFSNKTNSFNRVKQQFDQYLKFLLFENSQASFKNNEEQGILRD